MKYISLRLSLLAGFLAFCAGLAAQGVYEIYPVPHEQVPAEGQAKFTPTVDVVCDAAIDEPTRARLTQVLSDHALTAAFVAKPAKGKAAILLGVSGENGKADDMARKLALKRSIFQNGKYDRHILALRAGKNGLAQLLILGENTDAVFFGLASLEQMLDKGTSALPCVTIYDYADVKARGVIEGYYGMPYSVAVTSDLLRFMMRHKMSSYMYGAKSDAYHTRYWDKPYPDTLTPEQKAMGCFTSADMREVCKVSAATKVNFIWAIHPGKAFTGDDSGVIQRIMQKFEAMYGLGVRQFGVFVDDCGMPKEEDDPILQRNATRITALQSAMRQKWNAGGAAPADTVKPLHFVPQLYAYDYGPLNVRRRFYNELAKTPRDIHVYITGKRTWTVPNNDDLQHIRGMLGRDVSWWWNYPCNDNADSLIYTADMYANFTDMPKIQSGSRLPGSLEHCAAVLCNPMQQGEIDKIPLFSAADFLWNNAAFNAERSWRASIPAVVGRELAPAMAVVADYVRPGDAGQLPDMIDSYKMFGTDGALLEELGRIREACAKIATLKNSRDESQRLFYDDIEPWLLKLDATADICAQLLRVAETPHSADADAEQARKARYDKAAAAFAAMRDDPRYKEVGLEGMAAGITRTVYTVSVAKKHLTPFVEYLLEKAK